MPSDVACASTRGFVIAVLSVVACGGWAVGQPTTCGGPPGPGFAVTLDGSGYIVVADSPSLTLGTQATLECWARAAGSGHGKLLEKGDGWGCESDRSFELALNPYYHPADGNISSWWFSRPGCVEANRGGGWVPGTWFHFAATVDTVARLQRIYVNGQLFKEVETSPEYGSRLIGDSGTPMTIGGTVNPWGGAFVGEIDEVRIWSIARSPAQIASDFGRVVSPSAPGLIAYYRFDEGAGQLAHDLTGTNPDGMLTGGVSWTAIQGVSVRPTISEEPADELLNPSQDALFNVVADGEDLSYQWRKGGVPLVEGVRVIGNTSSELIIRSVISADQGEYDCVVSNACGEAISAPASLSCKAKVDRDPEGGRFSGGQPVVLSTQISTGGTTSYRWKKDGVNVFNGPIYSGVATTTLTVNANDPSQSGAYVLSITNACGVSTTMPAVLDITCPSDFNADGGIDGEDVAFFFSAWENGDPSADVSFDGGVDGADVSVFFERWENGC
jgi:hypothetical protein